MDAVTRASTESESRRRVRRFGAGEPRAVSGCCVLEPDGSRTELPTDPGAGLPDLMIALLSLVPSLQETTPHAPWLRQSGDDYLVSLPRGAEEATLYPWYPLVKDLEALRRWLDATQPHADTIGWIRRTYTLRGEGSVLAYLRGRPHVVALLLEAPGRLREVFGENYDSLVLELVSEVDELDDAILFLLVRTSLSSSEAWQRLSRLDEEWFLGASFEASCDIVLDLEPI